jgi:chromosome segregation ATPase
MAKQIKGNEIIQDNHLANAVLSAEQLKKAYGDLDKMMLQIIEHGKAVSKGTTLGSVAEIKKVTEAYNQTSAATKAAIELDQKLKGVDDELVKTKLKLSNASKEQKERLKELIAEEEKELGTLQKLANSNKKLAKERNTLNLETKEGSARLKEINAQIDKNNALIKQSSDLQKKQSLNVGNYKSAINGLNGALMQLGIGLSVFTLMRDAFTTVIDFDKATQSLSAV